MSLSKGILCHHENKKKLSYTLNKRLLQKKFFSLVSLETRRRSDEEKMRLTIVGEIPSPPINDESWIYSSNT